MFNVTANKVSLLRLGWLPFAGAVFAAFFLFAPQTHALTCTFTGAVSNDFNTAGNWDCSAVPTSTTDVVIPAATSTSATTATVNIASLDVGAGAVLDMIGQALNVLTGTTTNAGTITNNSGSAIFFQATTTNSGTIGSGGTGNVDFFGPVTNSGAFNVGSSYISFWDTWDNTGGTLNVAANVQILGSNDMTFPAGLTMASLNVGKFSSTARTTLSSDATSTGSVLLQGGILDLDGNTFHTKQWTDDVTGSLDANLGTVEIIGAGSSIRVSNEPDFYNLTINPDNAGDIIYLSGDIGVSAQLQVLNGILSFSTVNTNSLTLSGSGTGGSRPLIATASQFSPQDDVVKYTGTSTTDVEPVNYYALEFNGAGPYDLTASTTALGTTSVASTTTLAVGTNDFTSLGTITNTGLITVNTGGGGSIIHPNESHAFSDSAGVTVGTVNVGGRLYVTLQDSNLNLDGTAVETVNVTVSGSDSETLTLTETGAATGIFRNTTGMEIIYSSGATAANGRLEIPASETLTSTYTDPYDATETDLATVSASIALATPTPSSGGGGGGGLPASTPPPPPTTTYEELVIDGQHIPVHTLIKLPDDENTETQTDSAVYYIGSDGMRHSFSNAKVYFTWYESFDGIQIVSASIMSQIPLGKNVTYKPGVKMVKFTTDPKVYAVEKGGILRWVTSEAVATDLYGSDWNTKIDDISDAFYTDYSFGADIISTSGYNPATAEASVQFPSDSLAP